MSELETAAQQALVALEQFIEKELTVGQRYTKEGQALLDSIESLRGAFLQQEPAASPTSGMNIAQRILHVGGRNNAAGYVEFGSIQAVKALVMQVIRDLLKNTPLSQEWKGLTDEELLGIYEEEQQGRWGDHVRSLRAIEDKLKELNHG
jgi:hypothetical protein